MSRPCMSLKLRGPTVRFRCARSVLLPSPPRRPSGSCRRARRRPAAPIHAGHACGSGGRAASVRVRLTRRGSGFAAGLKAEIAHIDLKPLGVLRPNRAHRYRLAAGQMEYACLHAPCSILNFGQGVLRHHRPAEACGRCAAGANVASASVTLFAFTADARCGRTTSLSSRHERRSKVI
jgi:hypothetical protein